MKIQSLAFKTDLFFHRFTGVVLEYEDHIVVKTPTNPSFFWGNLLYFSHPPKKESLEKWINIFQHEFHSMSVNHMTFAWDSKEGIEGEAQDFVKAGFNLEKSIVMIADSVKKPSKLNSMISIRPIQTSEEWKSVIENHVLCREDHFQEEPYRQFIIKKIRDYRMMLDQKKGHWMGAFLGEKLVGNLGVFSENGLARFQMVGTHPDHRRMGVCSTLVYHTACFALQEMKVSQMVMVADPDYHAAKIYQSVGFEPKEMMIGLCKYNKDVWDA